MTRWLWPSLFAAALAVALVGAGAGATPVRAEDEPDQIVDPEEVPFAELVTHDEVEASFDGRLPDARGVWMEQRFFSAALEREVAYLAWLPPDYDADADRTYPVLYLLHGVGGPAGVGPEEWLGYALTETLERMLALQLVEPMIVVLPVGEQSYWMNHADGGPRWGDYVAQDLTGHVDATLRTTATREARAIGGLSMGGHGALQLAYNFPDVFSVAGAHSPALREFSDRPEFFGDEAWYARVDPRSLVENGADVMRITTWIDVGHDDLWRWRAQEVRDALVARSAPVTYHVLEGEHEGWYWMDYLPQYLVFYSHALHAPAWTPQGAPLVRDGLLTRNQFAPVA